MEALSYIFWVFCLVQIVTVSGRPDFATTFQFSTTTSISRLSNDISSLFASMDDGLHFMMSGSIPDSEAQRQLLAVFAEDFGVHGRELTDQLEASAGSTSSTGTTLNMVLSAYLNLAYYFNSNANAFLSNTYRQVGPFVAREFFSGLIRLVTSLPQVRAAVQLLQARLENASTAADVPSDVLRSLVRALHLLKAHLPLLVYSFQRLRVNLITADTFMVLFNQDLQALLADFEQEAVAFNTKVSRFETAVELMLTSVEEKFNSTGTQLDTELTGTVESQTNFMQLQTELKSFTSGRSLFVKNLKESILLSSMGNRQSVLSEVRNTYYYNEINTLDSPALVLVTQLIASNIFDQLCYNKYAALVADLPTLGRIRLNECFHTELPRLQKLRQLIETYATMVSYDVEDLWFNLKPCMSEFAASDCLSQVAAFYPQLLSARDSNAATRAGNFFTSAVTASLNRIGLCFARTNYFTFYNLVPTLVGNIRHCGFNG